MNKERIPSKERIIPIELENSSVTKISSDDDSNRGGRPKNNEKSRPLLTPTRNQQTAASLTDRSLPYWSSKEKIIIVVDRGEDDSYTHFKFHNNSISPLAMLQRSIVQFLHLKSIIDKRHEYALVFLNESEASLAVKPTNNIKELMDALNNVTSCETEDIFNLNTLFEVILEQVGIPLKELVDGVLMPPPFVARVIMFYGRSYTLPKLEMTEEVRKLLACPYFTFDVLMTHEPEDVNNNCSKIFDILQNLDQKGLAYFFSVGRNAKILHDSLGKLLAHPLQRPVLSLADYTIKDV